MSVTLPVLEKAIVLAFGGPAGSGKTTIANIIAPLIGPFAPANWLNTDAIRKQQAGVSWSTRLSSDFYTREARDQIYKEIGLRASQALKDNRSIIWDASFGRPDDRNLVRELAIQQAVPFLGLFFDAPIHTRCERAKWRSENPSDADEAYITEVEQFEYPMQTEPGWFPINAGGTVENTTSLVIARICLLATEQYNPQ